MRIGVESVCPTNASLLILMDQSTYSSSLEESSLAFFSTAIYSSLVALRATLVCFLQHARVLFLTFASSHPWVEFSRSSSCWCYFLCTSLSLHKKYLWESSRIIHVISNGDINYPLGFWLGPFYAFLLSSFPSGSTASYLT